MCSVRKSIHWHFYSKLCTVKRKISKISMVNNKQPWFIRLKCDILDSLEMGKNKCVFINLPGPLTLHSRWFHLIKQVYAFTSRTIHFSFECQVYLDLSSLMYQWTMLNLNQTDSIEQLSSLLLWSLNSRGIVFFGVGSKSMEFCIFDLLLSFGIQ